MALSVAKIAKLAFDGVAGAITGVIGPATLTFVTQGTYNQATRAYPNTPTELTGRAYIGTAAAIASSFPAFVAGPDDTLMGLEGFSSVPDVGWTVTFKGITREIKEIGDIAGAGGFTEVIAA